MEVINPHRFPVTAPPAVDFDGFGNASRYFDGLSDFISIPDFAHSSTNLTCMCWVKTSDTNFKSFFSHWDNNSQRAWLMQTDATTGLLCAVTSGGNSGYKIYYTPNDAISDGTWHHCAFSFESNDLRLFIDGVRITDINKTYGDATVNAIYNSTSDILIGADLATGASSSHIDGNIADCRIYDATLSESDIAAIYGGENITTNLVGHWLKDTPSLLDDIGTNDGTNVGSAFSYDNPSPAVEFGKASRVFDGVNDYIDLGDSDDFSFGDGATDSAFSVCGWVKMTDATLFRMLIKSANSSDTEWLLSTDGNDELTFALYDNAMNNYRGLKSSALTVHEDSWVHLAATYDGRGGASAQDGMSLYITTNGGTTTALTTSNFSAGTYVAMHNTSEPIIIGEFNNVYSDGSMADMRLYSKELSSAEIQSIADGENITTNLVGHWLTNTDDVKDYAGVNDGTNFGSTYSFDNPLGDGGEFGSASREFSGTNQYITLANSAFPTGDFSISLWVKRHTTDWYDYLSMWEGAGTNRKFALMNRNFTNRVIFYWIDNTNTAYNIGETSGTVLNANEWYHVGVTYETGVVVKVYINGVEDGSSTSAGTLQSSTADLMIAARDGSTAFCHDGNLADIRIYDTAITGTDMYDLSRGYDFRTNLVGQWLTNQDDVDDYAGSNNGTNTGSIYSQDAPL